ncbi:hypothetical protein KFZ76_14685 [Methylovulum psychrotolerans]|uniref:hypothetical protein n=1 Tax=Methylovulum psychrotolerans TaxID=1704499 RepID=UPI001BFF8FB9|nr:hypothetical protein [Methylovulum psychrotolerans]MBT9098950.1 hypothetical protein [Methylovulum psychrotolerans]
MEICFDILIPKICKADPMGLHEQFCLWGGGKFSQDPQRFAFGESVFFTKRTLPKHINNFIPTELDISAWEFLSLDSDALLLWEQVINKEKNIVNGLVPLKEFIANFLARLEKWIVVFELNCDQIDHVYKMTHNDLVCKIEGVLDKKNTPEGFVAWYNGTD